MICFRLPVAFVFCGDVHDAVGVDVKNNFDLGAPRGAGGIPSRLNDRGKLFPGRYFAHLAGREWSLRDWLCHPQLRRLVMPWLESSCFLDPAWS